MQVTEPKWYWPVYYSSQKLSKAEQNYLTTTKREALGMVYSVNQKFSFHVDHSALVYLVSKVSLTGKLARWTLLLQEFEFDIYHWPRGQYAVANYLSQLESGDGVRDEFPDTELFKITVEVAVNETMAGEDKWLTDMHQFLFTRLALEKLEPGQWKQLAVQKRHFCLVQDTLYHKGADKI